MVLLLILADNQVQIEYAKMLQVDRLGFNIEVSSLVLAFSV